MERPAHRVSFGGARDAETGEDAGLMSPGSSTGVPGSPQQPAYDPKSKRRHGLVRRAMTAVREVGAAKITSGAISIFLLLSVFSAIMGTNTGLERRPKKPVIHLKARELLPVGTPKIPAVKVDKSQFVQRKGTRLVLNGQTFKFAGASNYYMLTRAVEKATRPQVSEVFEMAQKMGITVIRMWAFNDGDTWNALQPRMGRVDERVLIDGLDRVVNEARRFGIRLIMVLTDSQGDYGGMAQYVRWAGPLTDNARDFYTSKRLRKAFKEYVGAIVLHKNALTNVHYRDEPAILGWEIANAPVCPGDDTGDLLQNWVEDLSGHVKALDQNHLVLLGHSGVFGASTPDKWQHNPTVLDVTMPVVPWAHAYDAVCEGADWVRNHEAPHVDIASVQVWPDDWMQAPEPWKLHWSRLWLRAHVDVSGWLKKPIIFSAFAKQRRTGQSDMATRNAFFEMVYQEAERSDAVTGTIIWLLASNSYPDYDGYTVYSSKVAVQQPAPAWPQLSPELADASLARRRFMNWEAMLACGAKRAMGNSTANQPVNPDQPGANPWLDGWADVLDVINSHSQAMAKLARVNLSKAALSHAEVPRRRYESALLPDAPVQALPIIPEDFLAPADEAPVSRQKGSDNGPGAPAAGPAEPGQQPLGQQQQARGNEQEQASSTGGSGSVIGGGTAGSQEAEAGASSGDFEATDAADAALLEADAVRAGAAAATETASNGTDATADGGVSSSNNSSSGSPVAQADGGSAATPVLNATEAAQIDFDDMGVGNQTPQGGFLARLTDSFSGALGGIFTSRPALDDELDAVDLMGDDGTEESDRAAAAGSDAALGGSGGGAAVLSLDEEEAEAQAVPAVGGLLGGVDSRPTPQGANSEGGQVEAAAGTPERSTADKAGASSPAVSAGNSGRASNATAPLLTQEEAELGVMLSAEEKGK